MQFSVRSPELWCERKLEPGQSSVRVQVPPAKKRPRKGKQKHSEISSTPASLKCTRASATELSIPERAPQVCAHSQRRHQRDGHP